MPKLRPAKVTRPRLHQAVPRHRLFQLLDGVSRHSAVWLSAPPGSGKTTGIAGYLEHHGSKGIWYQVDAGDEDPATFFHYLRVAAAHGGSTAKAARLPMFTPEFQWDLPGFARRFFRQLFDVLGSEALLVLDNVQEISPECVVHQALVEAVEALPDGQGLIAISREEAPGIYARLIANQRLARIEADSVRYTYEESTSIAKGRVPDLTADEISALHERSHGWAAGLTLLLEQVARGERVADVFRPDNLQAVFDYFASQVYARAEERDRQTLLDLCWLPRIPSEALDVVAPGRDAARLLDRLYRGHLFTHRRPSNAGLSRGAARGYVYQFHALFQSFLRERAHAALSREAVQESRRRSARVLESLAQFEDAFDLYAHGEDWDGAEALLASRTTDLLATGRWKTVLGWVDAIPPSRVAASPSLQLWRGLAISAAAPVDARPVLRQACEIGAQRGDARVCLFAAAAMVDTYLLEYTNFRGIDEWLDLVIAPLEDSSRLQEDDDIETWLHAAALNGMTFRRSAHPFRAQCVARLMALVPGVRDPNVGMGAVGALLLHAGLTGRVLLARKVEPLVAVFTSAKDLRPHVEAVVQFALAFCHHIDILRDPMRTQGCVATLEKIAKQHDLSYVQCFADMMRYMSSAIVKDEQYKSDAIARLDRYTVSGRPFDVGAPEMARAWAAVSGGDAGSAIQHGRRVVKIWERTGSLHHTNFSRIPLIWGLMTSGESLLAQEEFEIYCSASDQAGMPLLDAGRFAISAMMALERDDAEGADRDLIELLALISSEGCAHAIWVVPQWFSILTTRAAEKGFMPELVSELMRKAAIPVSRQASQGPSNHLPRIRIRTLGEFSLEVDDRAVVFSTKAPRKILTLLKCLVAYGKGGARLSRIAEDVWPDEDGDRASGALRTALHRLRGLLGNPRALSVVEGRVALDSALVWVDLFDFDRYESVSNASADEVDRLLHLYGGTFLPGDLDEPWAMTTRQRAQRRFEQAVEVKAAALALQSRWAEALALYEDALCRDEMAESFYRGRMRCLARLGREADALSTYSQLRRSLAIRFGISPSSETATLAEAIRCTQGAGEAPTGGSDQRPHSY